MEERTALIPSAGISSPFTSTPATMYFGALPNIPSADKNHELGQFQTIIREAKSYSEERGTRFLLAFVPIKARIYAGLVTLPEPIPRMLEADDIPLRLARWSEEENIDYVDLTFALRNAAESGQLVYYTDDTHWNDQGHLVVAQRIAEVIHGMGIF